MWGFIGWLRQPNGSLLYKRWFHFCPCTTSGLQGTPVEADSAWRISFPRDQMSARANTNKGTGPCRQEWRKRSRLPLPVPAIHLVSSTEIWNLSQGIGFLYVRLFIFVLASVFALFTDWLLTTSVSLELTMFLSCCAVGATQRPVPCVWCH